MSYSGYRGDNGNYAPSADNQSSAYGASRSSSEAIPTSTNATHPVSSSHQQYGPSAYSWPDRNQSNYGYTNGNLQNYGNTGSWKDGQAQQPTYDYQRPQANFASTSATSHSRNAWYGSSTQSQAHPSTQALSNLAYASGLDAQGQQAEHDHQPARGNSGSSQFHVAQHDNYGQSRAQSPPYDRAYALSNPQNPQTPLSEQSPTSSHQNLAVSAAAAVEGAVNGRYNNSPQQRSVSTQQHQLPAPLVNDSGNQNPTNTTTNQHQQRPASSHGVSNRGQPQTQSQPSSGARAEPSHHVKRYETTETHRYAHSKSPNIALPLPSTAQDAPSKPIHGATQQSSQNKSGGRGSLEESHTSTSSATTNDNTKAYNNPPQQRSHEPASSMPTFIDPSQVFNPYHKEHGRQNREEAGRAKRASMEASEVTVPEKRKEASIAPPLVAQAGITGASSKLQAAIAAGKDASVRSSSPSSSTTAERRDSVDVDMANEMKSMMQRMREWKTKDPSLFQKLWDDMKRGGSGTQPAKVQTPSHSPQLAQVTPQQPPQSQQSQPSQLQTAQTSDASQTKPSPAQSSAKPSSSSKRHWDLTMAVEKNQEVLPDLGRFPAERRNRRTNKEIAEKKAREEETKQTTQSQPTIPPESVAPKKQDAKLVWPTKASRQPLTTAEAPPVPTPTQPLPPASPNGGTIWAEAKRKSLTEAAQKALMGLTANKDKTITAAEIHALLEQNPSYIDLCTKLEARGFVFHRGQFARFLLNNVPDLASPSQVEHRVPQQPASSTAQSVKPPLQAVVKGNTAPPPLQKAPTQNSHPSAIHNGTTQHSLPPPHASSHVNFRLAPVPQAKATPSRPVKPRLGVPSPSIPAPVPGSKEANARKRDFSELVDLTQLSDDEDYAMPSKHTRLEASPEPRGFQIKTDTSSLPTLLPSQADRPSSLQTQAYGLSGHGPFGPTRGNASLKFDSKPQPLVAQLQSQLPSQPSQTMPPKSRHLLAKPLNKAEALRKSYYDPKTVARDILIAAGRHPGEHPLNAHLAGLLGKHIDIDSDLSTFDWDTVDPGGPPMPVVQVVDIPAGPPRWKLGSRMKPRGPTLGTFDPPLRMKAKERVKLSEPGYIKETSREKPDKSQVPDMQSSLARLSTQTRTILQESFPKPQKPIHQPTRLRESENVDEKSKTPPPALSRQQSTPHHTKSITPVASISISPSSENSIKRGPGRPRKSSIMAELSPEPVKRRRGRPPGSKSKHPSVSSLKKAARSSGVMVSGSTDRRSTSPLQYNTYACQWRKCDAKLHNLPTLRKHIARVHKVSNDEVKSEGQPCWWKKCRTLEIEGEEIVPKVTFNSTSDWIDHVESDHLYPLGLKLGDGPSSAQTGKPVPFEVSKYFYSAPTISNSGSSSSSKARISSHTDAQTLARDRQIYLSDEQGRSVTAPSTAASIADYSSDTLVLSSVTMNPESNIPNRAFSKAHGNEKMEIKQSAIETLLALQRHKERVGPGLDRGGCTLVNDERRATLIDNEGMARIVDGDY